MPNLPAQTQPIIPGSRYYEESVESYRPKMDDISGPIAFLQTKNVAGNEGLILALNKLLGAAPSRSARGRVSQVPSDESYQKAIEVLKAAQIPQEADAAKRVELLTAYMRNLGIPF